MSSWQIFSTFGIGFLTGITLGFFIGQALGFYFGQRVERKRISKLLAGKTALEIVQQLIATGTITPAEKKKAKPRQVWPPRDETRH